MDRPPKADDPRNKALTEWLLGDAKRQPNGPALLRELGKRLNQAGIPLARASLHIRTLHPQFYGLGFYWYRDSDDIRVFEAAHGVRDTDMYRMSPMRLLFDENVSEVRQSLDVAPDAFDFPLYRDLQNEGFTDYLSLPLTFSDGKVHGTTWTTDRQGGFEEADVDLIRSLMPLCSLLGEINLNRRIAINLLDAYVGHQAGERILSGQITRGSGESVEAAIWFSDLRGFTAMSENKGRDEIIGLLNLYFDQMAEAVKAHGGEILKFIGDAVLAIFPLAHGADEDVCGRAFRAALEAQASMARLNEERAAANQDGLACGIALHVGEVMYGNIGSADRLDFTVIGPAVNLTSRIEGMCRRLGPNVLLSDQFAERIGGMGSLRSLGRHRLPGIRREVELFTPDTDAEEAA